MQKRDREEQDELRTVKLREQQFQNRDYFQYHDQKEEQQKRRRKEVHSGCSALTVRRRRNRQKIARRNDSSECHAYLEDMERRRVPKLFIEYEEALLAGRSNYLPGKE